MEYELCEEHNIHVALVSLREAKEAGLAYGCTGCQNTLERSADPQTMSNEDRVDEMYAVLHRKKAKWAGIDAVWQRIDKLVGRSVYTHELAYPEYLEHEIMTGTVPSMEGIIAKLPENMEVIVVLADGSQSS